MKILFQGDSITHAFRQPDEVNPAFQLGNGYAFLIAARLAYEYPEVDLEFINRGRCGISVSDLSQSWQTDALELNPDVLSLLVGVNDVVCAIKNGQRFEPDKFALALEGLIDPFLAKDTPPEILLLEPFLLPGRLGCPAALEALPHCQNQVRAVAASRGVRFVPLQELIFFCLQSRPSGFLGLG